MPGTASIAVANPGGQTTSTLTMTVRTPGAAIPTSTSRVTLNARDLVWDDRTGRIYVSVPGSAMANANSIVAVDPVTATTTASVFVGSNPTKLARSDDGQFLYVGLDGANAVQRVDLPSLTPGLAWPLRLNEVAGQIRVLPGMPGSVAISGRNLGISPSFSGVTIFDNGIPRSQITPSHTGAACIEFLDSPNVLYGYNNQHTGFEFFTVGVDAAGAHNLSATSDLISGFYTNITGGAGRIYGTDGSVVDAERRVRVASLAGSGSAMLVEPSTGRAYVLNGSGITVYDLNTFQTLGTVSVPGVGQSGAFGGQRLVRWGSDGIAFLDDDELFIVRSPIFAP
jgi:DNA-binding beta-propeller fold protein YncE